VLAAELNAKESSVARIARRSTNVFAKIRGTDGTFKIALAERRAS
jgi:hypothetical protein